MFHYMDDLFISDTSKNACVMSKDFIIKQNCFTLMLLMCLIMLNTLNKL